MATGCITSAHSHPPARPWPTPTATAPAICSPTGSASRSGISGGESAAAQEIADLYKRRWGIELFFRWVKQALRIRRFLGYSANAVRIQVATAMIAFLLLRLAQATQSAIQSPLTFARLVRCNLMHRRAIRHLLHPEPASQPQKSNVPANQMVLV